MRQANPVILGIPLTFYQDRPCARCIKRSIGHLCHDEPRDSSKGRYPEEGGSVHDVKEEEAIISSQAPFAIHQADNALPRMTNRVLDPEAQATSSINRTQDWNSHQYQCEKPCPRLCVPLRNFISR